MKDEELLQCPLLHGLDAMHRAEILGLLNQGNLRERLEKCLADRPHGAEASASQCGCEPKKEFDFAQEARSWNPNVSLWRRGAKE